MSIEVVYEHQNVGSLTDYNMKDTFIVSVDGLGTKATVITPFNEISVRCHDWRVRKAARQIAKTLRIPGVTKRTLRPYLWKALENAEKKSATHWEGRA